MPLLGLGAFVFSVMVILVDNYATDIMATLVDHYTTDVYGNTTLCFINMCSYYVSVKMEKTTTYPCFQSQKQGVHLNPGVWYQAGVYRAPLSQKQKWGRGNKDTERQRNRHTTDRKTGLIPQDWKAGRHVWNVNYKDEPFWPGKVFLIAQKSLYWHLLSPHDRMALRRFTESVHTKYSEQHQAQS